MATASAPSPIPRTIGLRYALVMYVLIALSYVINAMDRSVFSNLVKAVNTEFHLSLAQGGFLSTVFAIGFGLTGIFAGFLLDRWRRKNVMITGILIYSVFTLLIPLAQGFWSIGAFRLITGVGEAMQQTAIFTMAGVFFAQNRNLAIGGMNVAYGLGSFLGPIIGTQIFLSSASSWRPPLYVFGVLGLVFAGIALFALSPRFSEYGRSTRRSPTTEVDTSAEPDPTREKTIPTRWFNRNVALLGLANISLGLVNYSYVGLYPTFLKSELHFSVSTAAFAQSMYGIGAFTGIVSGYLADRYGERKMINIAVVGTMITGILMFNVAGAFWQQAVLSFFFGTFASGFLFVNVYALTQRSVRSEHIGKASGVASSAHYIGAGFAGAVFGALAEHWGWGGASVVQMLALPLIALVLIGFVRLHRVQVLDRA